jgi:hypothetical protein
MTYSFNGMKSVASYLSFTVSIFLMCACSAVKFSAIQSDPSAAATAKTPATPSTCSVESIQRMTKILFIVDQSGSNADLTFNYNSAGVLISTPPTDPTKSFRAGAISTFLSSYRHKSNFQWGFITFSGSSARALISPGGVSVNSSVSGYAVSPASMDSALSAFESSPDQGQTPYHAALSMAAQAIHNDPDNQSSSKPNYFVILLTDGYPTDYYDQNGKFETSALDQDITNLVASGGTGTVSLSSVYYGQGNDPSAINLLQSIASNGGGQFANVNTSSSAFKIDDVLPGAGSTCH